MAWKAKKKNIDFFHVHVLFLWTGRAEHIIETTILGEI